MIEFKIGDWVRVLPSKWSIESNWNGRIGIVINATELVTVKFKHCNIPVVFYPTSVLFLHK